MGSTPTSKALTQPPEWTRADPGGRARADMSPAGKTGRILVVEDDHLVALDIQRHLQRMGHEVVVVYSGEAAVTRAVETKFDLILMDIKLGGPIDGIDAARTIRGTLDMPIVYLTAYADRLTLDRARMTEPYGYVLKPFQDRELRATIEMALQRHGSDARRWEQQQVQHFLSDASSMLAGSLDYEAVARGAAELMVPHYADWCAIQLREANDSVPSFVFTRPTSPSVPPPGYTPPLIELVLRGREELMTQILDDESLRAALGPHHLDVLREVGARSLLCVPLIAREHVLGALALVSGRVRERFRPDDLAIAQDFAHRLAMALDNALLYRKAARAIEMRDDVLAIVSHDLRSPLGVILMQTELLEANEQLHRVGRSIGQAAQRMNRLIGDLLDASAINAGRLTLEIGGFPPDEIVKEAAGMFQSQAEARSVELRVTCAPDLRLVSCDRDRIIQLLSNLIGNAIKFTAHGGLVQITAGRNDGQVRFQVEDNGCGIPPEQLPHLFERFWRAQGKPGGAGLGLFIARGIAVAHGSTLGVESELAKGSRCFFSLREQSG